MHAGEITQYFPLQKCIKRLPRRAVKKTEVGIRGLVILPQPRLPLRIALGTKGYPVHPTLHFGWSLD